MRIVTLTVDGTPVNLHVTRLARGLIHVYMDPARQHPVGMLRQRIQPGTTTVREWQAWWTVDGETYPTLDSRALLGEWRTTYRDALADLLGAVRVYGEDAA